MTLLTQINCKLWSCTTSTNSLGAFRNEWFCLSNQYLIQFCWASLNWKTTGHTSLCSFAAKNVLDRRRFNFATGATPTKCASESQCRANVDWCHSKCSTKDTRSYSEKLIWPIVKKKAGKQKTKKFHDSPAIGAFWPSHPPNFWRQGTSWIHVRCQKLLEKYCWQRFDFNTTLQKLWTQACTTCGTPFSCKVFSSFCKCRRCNPYVIHLHYQEEWNLVCKV